MVTEEGLEPSPPESENDNKSGQDKSSDGQKETQLGNNKRVNPDTYDQNRTDTESVGTRAGHAKSPISTQYKHNRSTMDEGLPPVLRQLIRTWPKLPEHICQAIITLLQSAHA